MVDEETMYRVLGVIIDEAERTKSKAQELMVWRIFHMVNNVDGQTKHISDEELAWMKVFKKLKWSIREIAFMCDRPKSTVHERLVKG